VLAAIALAALAALAVGLLEGWFIRPVKRGSFKCSLGLSKRSAQIERCELCFLKLLSLLTPGGAPRYPDGSKDREYGSISLYPGGHRGRVLGGVDYQGRRHASHDQQQETPKKVPFKAERRPQVGKDGHWPS
jgi:hypothetical protein